MIYTFVSAKNNFENDLFIIDYNSAEEIPPFLSSLLISPNIWFSIEDTKGVISHLLEDYHVIEHCPIKNFPLTSTFSEIQTLINGSLIPSEDSSALFLVHQLIIDVADFLYGSSNIQSSTRAEQICQYMEENVYGRITLEQLCNVSGLGKTQLISIFKTTYGQSPIDYLLDRKIATAKERLLNTQQAVSQIAIDLGFYDAQHFIKIFKQHTGTTPKKFRKNYSTGESTHENTYCL